MWQLYRFAFGIHCWQWQGIISQFGNGLDSNLENKTFPEPTKANGYMMTKFYNANDITTVRSRQSFSTCQPAKIVVHIWSLIHLHRIAGGESRTVLVDGTHIWLYVSVFYRKKYPDNPHKECFFLICMSNVVYGTWIWGYQFNYPYSIFQNKGHLLVWMPPHYIWFCLILPSLPLYRFLAIFQIP